MSKFRAGQNLTCVVVQKRKDGYAVNVLPNNLPGYLNTDKILEEGEEIVGVFVCVQNGLIYLSPLFAGPQILSPDEASANARRSKFTSLNREEHASAGSIHDETQLGERPQPPKPKRTHKPHGRHREEAPPTTGSGAGSTKISQHLTVVPQSNVSALRGVGGGELRHRRGIDIFVPPVDLKSIRAVKNFKVSSLGLEGLINDLETSKHNGCLKVSSDDRNARAAALFYGGRVVGCVYSCKDSIDNLSNEEALEAMLLAMQDPQCDVSSYTLPKNVILPMSALFIGQPVERNTKHSASDYFNFVANWIAENDTTACITLVHPEDKLMNLIFFFQGQAEGIFSIDSQKYTHNTDATGELFEKYEDTMVDACLLKDEIETEEALATFGFHLGEAFSKATSTQS